VIRKIQYCRHIVVCARDHKPDYPGAHFTLNPKGSGLVVVDSVDKRVISGSSFAKHVGKPISQLTWPLRGLIDTRIIINPTGLNPEAMYESIRSLVRRTGATLAKRKEYRWPFDIVFWVSDPEEMLEDPVICTIRKSLKNVRPEPNFQPYWPEMPKEVFAEIFGYLHPNYAADEAKKEATRIGKEAIKAIRRLEVGRARDLLWEMDEVLGKF